MVADATVVAFGEGVHGAAEPLEFRNRMLQYLVEHADFTAIAIESGIVEGRLVDDYVRGASSNLEAVLKRGISWKFDRFPQNHALVEWLREYNAGSRRTRKISFYGFDISGCPAATRPHFGHDTAIEHVLRFLRRFDTTAADVFGARFARFVPSMRFHPCEQIEGPRYGALSQADRDALTAAIADMIVWLERHEGKYTSASTADEYAWAHRAAIAARQMDSWLRQVPAAWTEGGAQVPAEEGSQFISAGTDIRDRAQVDNIEWILRREGVAGKLLVFASRYHLSAAPVKIGWSPDAHESVQEVAGTYLRRRLGEQLVTIGNLLGGGQIQRGNDRESLARPPAHSFEGLAREIGAPFFLLDVRCAPRDVAEWLSQEHQLAAGSHVLKLSVREAFDLLFYIDTVTPACENTALACEA